MLNHSNDEPVPIHIALEIQIDNTTGKIGDELVFEIKSPKIVIDKDAANWKIFKNLTHTKNIVFNHPYVNYIVTDCNEIKQKDYNHWKQLKGDGYKNWYLGTTYTKPV